jgi:hypothetical protein
MCVLLVLSLAICVPLGLVQLQSCFHMIYFFSCSVHFTSSLTLYIVLSCSSTCYLLSPYSFNVLQISFYSSTPCLLRATVYSSLLLVIKRGEGMEMGRSVYEQPGTKVDGILSQQGVFQVSRRETKGGKKKWEKKKTEARGLHHNYVVR